MLCFTLTKTYGGSGTTIVSSAIIVPVWFCALFISFRVHLLGCITSLHSFPVPFCALYIGLILILKCRSILLENEYMKVRNKNLVTWASKIYMGIVIDIHLIRFCLQQQPPTLDLTNIVSLHEQFSYPQVSNKFDREDVIGARQEAWKREWNSELENAHENWSLAYHFIEPWFLDCQSDALLIKIPTQPPQSRP